MSKCCYWPLCSYASVGYIHTMSLLKCRKRSLKMKWEEIGVILLSSRVMGAYHSPLHFVTCVSQVIEADLYLSCLAGWGISRALPSRFSYRLCWNWPGKWRPVPPAGPHLQPPTCEEAHLLRGPVKQPEQGCAAQATVCKPRTAAEQVTYSLMGVVSFGLKRGIRVEYPSLYRCC